MGLIKAFTGAVGGVLADQWKDYYYCDALDVETMVVKGKKRVSPRSSNIHGNQNIITKDSILAVADGQCMMIVEQGEIIDICAEPGEYVFDSSSEPSIFSGSLDDASISAIFDTIGKRFTFGGEAPKDQRVYYFNTKEFTGNPYGTPAPVPFRIIDTNVGLDVDISIRCFGEYSYRITNPLLFYKNVCGNVEDKYVRSQIDAQLKSELLTSLQPAFAEISERGIRYSSLPKHTAELAESLNHILSEKWRNTRGIEIAALGISSVKADAKDEQMIKELQRNAAFRDPTMAAAQLVGAQSSAMQEAARNQNAGPAMAFMGMNMASQAGGLSAQDLFQMGMKKSVPENNTITDEQWKCTCGHIATGKFCSSCGAKRPVVQKEYWVCKCGSKNDGFFCPNCGEKKPEVGAIVCNNCGWKSQGLNDALRFCPQCGNPLK